MAGTERFRPSVTVAAVIARDGRYLLVEEETPEGLRLNNPAGHLEQGESPVEAVVREALEETARVFVPEAFLGVYLARFQRPQQLEDVTYVRLAFGGSVGEAIAGRALDEGIRRTLWLGLDELRACRDRHRSPLVLSCIADHAAGRRLPLDSVQAHGSLAAPLQPR
ncbi:NUDIX domain-containing protein [Pelomonas aquatica]|jgi:8-oxo-dGTP pyrophosphatase MutT (NUDIX family)|uniref:NUDIX hydrolase n=1 Tax=Pelomonas aquatica TaxID=431058 RepID=A0A9X4LGS5_9BURK|nr:NUDIX hydrolase [Pelomonas aquatica]MCY4755814.1 NUDIX hydrolase [Pelomonas aquatica]MDG0863212.1 NUDIX hydrolase [Pelomonas aquatica]